MHYFFEDVAEIADYIACDTQLYTSRFAAGLLLRGIDDVNRWMSSNRQTLNPDKMQLIWLGAARIVQSVSRVPPSVGGVDSIPLDSVCDLRVMTYAQRMMQNEVDDVASSCFYQLRPLQSIRR